MNDAVDRAALLKMRCSPQPKGAAWGPAEVAAQLARLPGWQASGAAIEREFRFPDFRRAIAFVNAVAVFADEQDHHPDLEVGWGRCTVRWGTHSAAGITVNDFVCAALTDAAFERGEH